MNRFRLLEACPKQDFSAYTGLPITSVEDALAKAEQLGLINTHRIALANQPQRCTLPE